MAPRLSRWLAGALLAAAVSAGTAAAAARVVGGTTIEVQAAPWTVFVEQAPNQNERYLCTGSIIDPTHVLTAAHCVYDTQGQRARASQLTIEAGVSNFSAPLPTDLAQSRSVSAVRVPPDYHWTGRAEPDDVAVLVLSAPLDLGGPTARAIALPAANAPFPNGTPVGLAGFGRDSPTVGSSGPLAWMTGTIEAQGTCTTFNPFGLLPNNAIMLCASAATSAVCQGDSGSALVTIGRTPTILGVADAGARNCEPGTDGVFAYVGAPEILRFIHGDDDPPTAPRPLLSTVVRLRWPPPLVDGDTLSCSSRGWSNEGRVTYSFLDTDGTTLQSGPRSTFLIPPREAYEAILCEVAIKNGGGTTLADSQPTPVVELAPAVEIAPLAPMSGVRGGDVTVHVTLRTPAGLWGKVGVCVALPRHAGGRACSSRRGSGLPAALPFAVRLRIEPTARLGTSRLTVDAVAGVSSARTTAALRIS